MRTQKTISQIRNVTKMQITLSRLADRTIASIERWRIKFAWTPTLVDEKIIWLKFYRAKEVKILLWPKPIWLTLKRVPL